MTRAKSDYICLRVGVPFVLLQIVCFDKNCCLAAVVQSKQELSALQEQAAVARC